MNKLSGHRFWRGFFVKLINSVLNYVSEYLKRCHNVKVQLYAGSAVSIM